jgi:hypothetical protein
MNEGSVIFLIPPKKTVKQYLKMDQRRKFQILHNLSSSIILQSVII